MIHPTHGRDVKLGAAVIAAVSMLAWVGATFATRLPVAGAVVERPGVVEGVERAASPHRAVLAVLDRDGRQPTAERVLGLVGVAALLLSCAALVVAPAPSPRRVHVREVAAHAVLGRAPPEPA